MCVCVCVCECECECVCVKREREGARGVVVVSHQTGCISQELAAQVSVGPGKTIFQIHPTQLI